MSLSARKKRAVLALVEHGAVSQAADACGCARSTLYKWMQDPEFISALSEASSSRVAEASRRLDALLMLAIDRLEKLIDSRSERIALQAVNSVQTHAAKLHELTELEQRVAALEKRERVR